MAGTLAGGVSADSDSALYLGNLAPNRRFKRLLLAVSIPRDLDLRNLPSKPDLETFYLLCVVTQQLSQTIMAWMRQK